MYWGVWESLFLIIYDKNLKNKESFLKVLKTI